MQSCWDNFDYSELDFNWDGSKIVVLNNHGRLSLGKVDHKEKNLTKITHLKTANQCIDDCVVAFSKNDKYLAAIGEQIRIVNPENLETISVMDIDYEPIGAAFARDENILAVSSVDFVKFYSIEPNAALVEGLEIKELTKTVTGGPGISFGANFNWVALGYEHGGISLHMMDYNNEYHQFVEHVPYECTREVYDLAFSPFGNYLASVSGDDTLRIFSVDYIKGAVKKIQEVVLPEQELFSVSWCYHDYIIAQDNVFAVFAIEKNGK
jgi:WD40 repeat protein